MAILWEETPKDNALSKEVTNDGSAGQLTDTLKP